jgi:hypothetical protein
MLVSEEHAPAVNIRGWWGVPSAVRKAGRVKVVTCEKLRMKLRCMGGLRRNPHERIRAYAFADGTT